MSHGCCSALHGVNPNFKKSILICLENLESFYHIEHEDKYNLFDLITLLYVAFCFFCLTLITYSLPHKCIVEPIFTVSWSYTVRR